MNNSGYSNVVHSRPIDPACVFRYLPWCLTYLYILPFIRVKGSSLPCNMEVIFYMQIKIQELVTNGGPKEL